MRLSQKTNNYSIENSTATTEHGTTQAIYIEEKISFIALQIQFTYRCTDILDQSSRKIQDLKVSWHQVYTSCHNYLCDDATTIILILTPSYLTYLPTLKLL